MSPEAWGWYGSIFLWLFFTGIGIPPCPEEAGIIYAAGVTALHPDVKWWLAWPAASAAIICADMVLYGIGRLWGRRLFDYRWVQRLIKPDRRQRMEDKFHGHGLKILLTARLLPPLRTGVFIVAGAVHYPFLRFLLADGLYAIFGVGLFFFGSAWAIQLVNYVGHWLIYVVAAGVAPYLLYHYFGHLHRREQRGTAEPPVSVLEVPVQNPAADQPASPGVRNEGPARAV